MGRTLRGLAVLLALTAGFAYGESRTKRPINLDSIQLQEHLLGTITRIYGNRIRLLEDEDPNGCATSGVRLIDIVQGTKLLRNGAVITESDLHRGDRILVVATARGQILEAIEIQVQDVSSIEHAH
jgi:hypothetical protein